MEHIIHDFHDLSSTFLFLKIYNVNNKIQNLEVVTGIEPAQEDLQSTAQPLDFTTITQHLSYYTR